MAVHRLSRKDARRLAVRAQLFGATRPAGLHDLVADLTLLQIDPVNAVAPNADLICWSRLGAGYEPAHLAAALRDRTLLEFRGMIRPAADLRLYTAEMAAWPGENPAGWRAERARWVAANDACRRDILARLGADGPVTARELPDTCAVPWKSTGWTNDRNVSQLLEFLVARGEVAVAGRRGNERLWDLAERVYPGDEPVPAAAAQRERDERRLASLGICRVKANESLVEPQHVGQAGEPAVVEGVRGEWRVDPALLDGLGEDAGRVALVPPLDRMIFDRKRMAELFAFDYQLEMYKPKAKRRWGYYALPILAGDRLVGKLDATADRRAGVLRVHAIHQDEPFGPELAAAVRAEIDDLATWLDMTTAEGEGE